MIEIIPTEQKGFFIEQKKFLDTRTNETKTSFKLTDIRFMKEIKE